MFNDTLIDHNLRIAEERKNFGQPRNQKIPVADDILLEIVLRHWKLDVLEIWFSPDWRLELRYKTGNEQFLTLSPEDLKAYRVRASMLLEWTPEYIARMDEQRKSRSYFQTGSEVAGYIAWVLDKGSGMD